MDIILIISELYLAVNLIAYLLSPFSMGKLAHDVVQLICIKWWYLLYLVPSRFYKVYKTVLDKAKQR
jgi:hypothetical protein